MWGYIGFHWNKKGAMGNLELICSSCGQRMFQTDWAYIQAESESPLDVIVFVWHGLDNFVVHNNVTYIYG